MTCSHSQGSSPDNFGSSSPQYAPSYAAGAQWKYSSSQVSLRFWCRHSLTFQYRNQESCNYGALERAESCAELSFSQQVGSVFSPQKTVSLPLLSRPIILAVYERISLPPLSLPHSHNIAWNLLLSSFWQ